MDHGGIEKFLNEVKAEREKEEAREKTQREKYLQLLKMKEEIESALKVLKSFAPKKAREPRAETATEVDIRTAAQAARSKNPHGTSVELAQEAKSQLKSMGKAVHGIMDKVRAAVA